MHSLFTLVQTALYMIFVQNLVFSGGYGSSEAIPTTEFRNTS